jgi:hypothetical protein
MTTAVGLNGRGRIPRWRIHSATIVCAISIGAVLLWIAVPSPWGIGVFEPQSHSALQPRGGPNGTVQFDSVLEFVNHTSFPVATVRGDVQLNLTGPWSASAPTWVWHGYSTPYSVPACYPYCGNASQGGVINWEEIFCTDWPGGGTSYWWGQNLTSYVVFWTSPNASDTVSIDLTAVVTALNVCPAY